MIYVHTKRHRISSRSGRKSRKKHPVSYGPFDNKQQAREWIAWRGVSDCTLKTVCAAYNIAVRQTPIINTIF